VSFCPLIQKKCVQHKCDWYTHLLGMDPQTGQPTDKWGCAVSYIPILLVENTVAQRQTAASVDKTTNQIQRGRAMFMGALPDESRQRLLQCDPKVIENGNP
jgi:hypothetical protein